MLVFLSTSASSKLFGLGIALLQGPVILLKNSARSLSKFETPLTWLFAGCKKPLDKALKARPKRRAAYISNLKSLF